MINPTEFHKIVSGERRDLRAMLWRGLFRLAEIPYGVVVGHRNRRYDTGKSEIHRVDVPVISVGNLTTGGTGKTPMVAWLARWLRENNVRVSLISRGYGAEKGSVNDEALELEQKLPDVPHLQNPDRVEAAQTAIEELETQIIVLDDAFQHRRIHRDLDIVLIDALEPFGYGHLLPRGLLREPVASLARADVVALSRSDMVDQSRREEIRTEVRRHAPNTIWIELAHQPARLVSSSGGVEAIDSLQGKSVAAFCGIGNPVGFRHTLESSGFEVKELKEFPDHHRYDRKDIEQLIAWGNDLDEISALVCTHKDLVKVSVDQLGQRPLWALEIGMEVLTGREQLEEMLVSLC